MKIAYLPASSRRWNPKRIEAIRIFLAFASFMKFIVYQMDVKCAFLYGTIEEEVYVSQPSGFIDPRFLNKVYKVEKALYGLHQALGAWYLKGHPKLSLWYLRDSPFDLEAYSDSDYAGENLDRKSTTGEEEVYVSQPSGFIDPQFLNKVYKVEKALYGLHQALGAWGAYILFRTAGEAE
nr:putative ribonuclease H-like domain-containing protein [Tanacetum cinerariifolium]